MGPDSTAAIPHSYLSRAVSDALTWFGSHTPSWADSLVHPSGLHNFSRRTFSPIDILFLSNGLRFIPTPRPQLLSRFISDYLHDDQSGWPRFARRLSTTVLHQHAIPADKRDTEFRRKFSIASSRGISHVSRAHLEDNQRESLATQLHYLQQYRTLTHRLLTEAVTSPATRNMVMHFSRNNVTRSHREFLRCLVDDPELTIKPADKNLGLVLLDTSWYRDTLLNMLSDRVTYRPFNERMLRHDGKLIPCTAGQLGTKIMLHLNHLVDRHQTAIECWAERDERRARRVSLFLRYAIPADKARLPEIYLLPKVHKPTLSGRPIVPCTRWVTTPASVLVDHLLQEILVRAKIPWLVKDTKSLIVDIESHVFLDVAHTHVFVMADIVSLYTHIDTPMGLTMVQEFLHDQQIPHAHAQLILALLTFVMHHSYLTFDNGRRVFQQVDGTAMGTPCAPAYANIVVYMLERRSIQRMLASGRLLFYRRFLDDIIAHARDQSSADELAQCMNTLHPKIRFEFETHPTRAHFLDLEVFIGPRFEASGVFDLRVFQKKMNLYLYIPYTSYHTAAAKRAFILTELQRYIRNSSSWDDYVALKHVFYQRLRDRGYPAQFLEPVFNSVYYEDRAFFLGTRRLPSHVDDMRPVPRSACLQRRVNAHSTVDEARIQPLTFIIPYTPLSDRLPTRAILLTYWELMKLAVADSTLPRVVIAYRSEPSILRLLVHSKSLAESGGRASSRCGGQAATPGTPTRWKQRRLDHMIQIQNITPSSGLDPLNSCAPPIPSGASLAPPTPTRPAAAGGRHAHSARQHQRISELHSRHDAEA